MRKAYRAADARTTAQPSSLAFVTSGSAQTGAATGEPVGAYGLRLRGVDSARALLVPAKRSWPSVELVSRIGETSADPYDRVSERRAELRLRGDGRILIERDEGRVVFTAPNPPRLEELVHPFLAPVASVYAYWLGRESFHAGAFVAGDGVWALIGNRESGKSSTLAWLALAGYEVVCDDALILDGPNALPGPRSVDLRPEAARALAAGEPIGLVGSRERWRLTLGPVRSDLPLRGWIFLAWADRLESVRLPGPERLVRLGANRGARLPLTHPASLVELAALPGWELRRRRGWDSLVPAAERLLETVAD
jgi:hypothetical protein